MKNKKIKRLPFSLNTGLILIIMLLLILSAGAILIPFNDTFSYLYVMPLFYWVKEVSLTISWWLVLAIVLIAFLTLNTILCSIESVIKKLGSSKPFIIIGPQIIHAGFLFILLAHLLSSYGAYREIFQVREGSILRLSDGSIAEIKEIVVIVNPSGYITDTGLRLIHNHNAEYIIRPNNPFFHRGIGIYIKTAYPYPAKLALIEITREPGAIPAIIGAVLFVIGNIILLVLKTKNPGAT